MDRQPPSLAIRDQTLGGEVVCELIEVDKQHRWGNLSQPVQTRFVQDWVTRQWTDLEQFCFANGLLYDSVYKAFKRRKLLDRNSL